MSALVKFNDRNHVETTVLPTYHFQDALPSLVLYSNSYYDFSHGPNTTEVGALILLRSEKRMRFRLSLPSKNKAPASVVF